MLGIYSSRFQRPSHAVPHLPMPDSVCCAEKNARPDQHFRLWVLEKNGISGHLGSQLMSHFASTLEPIENVLRY